jgi:hypothetical protein
MKVEDIAKLLEAELIVSSEHNSHNGELLKGFASDLMSDVLTLEQEGILLITGLCNNQTIRTAEMANIGTILFVRKKMPTEEMIELAQENNINLLRCEYSMFKTIGILYSNGMEAVY